MKNLIRYNGIRAVVFFLILALLFSGVQAVMTPKWRYDSATWGTDSDTDRYGFFYKLPENTVDYFTIGSSTSFFSVNPTRIYAETGITGYDLGSSAAGISLAYHMLKEGLKTQSPQIVFIDVSLLTVLPALPTQQKGFFTQAVIQMKLSFNKLEVALTAGKNYQSIMEVLFPLAQFHDRWEELSKNDFDLRITSDYCQNGAVSPFYHLMSTSILDRPAGSIYMLRDGTVKVREDAAQINEESAAYFEKILTLCAENGIEAIPTHFASIWQGGKEERIKAYLGSLGLELLDLTVPAVGLDWAQDTTDSGVHTNFWGSAKVSAYLAKYLQEKSFEDHRGQSGYELWDETLEKYLTWEQEELGNREIVQAYNYLNKLAAVKDDYLIVLTVQDEASLSWNDTLEAALRHLGVESSFYGQLQQSFVAILDQGINLFERWDGREIDVDTTFQASDGRPHDLYVISAGFPYGPARAPAECSCSVQIDAEEYACQSRGLNIVVIDKDLGKVVSSVAIDSYASDLLLTTKELPEDQAGRWLERTEDYQLVEDGIYSVLYYYAPALALDVADGSADEDANIQINVNRELPQQKFELTHVGDGLYTVRAVCSGKYLTVANMGNTASSNVVQQTYTGLSNQKWFLTINVDGYYSFTSLYSGQMLSVSGGLAATGTNVIVFPVIPSGPQQFLLEPVG